MAVSSHTPLFRAVRSSNAMIKKDSFLSLTSPILAYTGISIGKDQRPGSALRDRMAIVVFIGTYIGSAVIAEPTLKTTGQV